MGYCSRRCSFTSPFLQKAAFWGPRPFGLLQSSLLLHVSFSPKSGFLGPRLFELLQSSLLLHASFSPKSGFLGAPALWAIAVVAAPSHLLFSKKRFFWGPGSLGYCSVDWEGMSKTNVSIPSISKMAETQRSSTIKHTFLTHPFLYQNP